MQRSYVGYVRGAMVAVLGLATVLLVAFSIHWPLQKDAQVIHYINFLMAHGYAPYRDITDMNMPGAYMIEGWGMHLFGMGDVAWRVYDFALLALTGAAMIVIAMPYDWLAGLFAGVIFALTHVVDGPGNTGERDQVMAALIIVGFAFLFEALRRKQPWLMVLFGLSLGMAGSVKPTVAPLGFVLLLMVWWTLRKRGEGSARYLWGGLAGAAIATAIFVGFLYNYHAWDAFVDISRRLTPYYASLNRTSFHSMLRTSLAASAMILLPFALVAALLDREWKSWERWALLLGVAFGAASYFAQGKGYTHHRYPMNAFILIWMAIELTLAMRRQGLLRAVGFAGMALGTFVVAPWYVYRIHIIKPVNVYTESIEADLAHLGVDNLQRKVQCFDLVDGCLNALYHLRVVQSTGSTGDLLFFTPIQTPVTQFYKDFFWQQMEQSQPTVLVISNEWWSAGVDGFSKVNQWPLLADYLKVNFDLTVSRHFPSENGEAYRIYVRKGSGLPSLEGGKTS